MTAETATASASAAASASARLAVHVTPKAGSDRIDGLVRGEAGTELAVRVRAVPEDGKANKAVCVVVAKWLGVPKSAVEVVAGHTSRHKRLEIAGLSQKDLDSRLSVLE